MNMETIFSILFVIIVIAVGFFFTNLAERKQKKLLHIQADKRAGEVEDNSFPPRLLLTSGNLLLAVYSKSVGYGRIKETKTIAELDTLYPNKALASELVQFPRIEVTRSGFFQPAPSMGLKQFRSGNESFDKVFTIYSEDDSTIRQVLTSDIQQNLLALAKKSPTLKIGPSVDYVTFFSISGSIKNTDTYDLFIETAISILRNISNVRKIESYFESEYVTNKDSLRAAQKEYRETLSLEEAISANESQRRPILYYPLKVIIMLLLFGALTTLYAVLLERLSSAFSLDLGSYGILMLAVSVLLAIGTMFSIRKKMG